MNSAVLRSLRFVENISEQHHEDEGTKLNGGKVVEELKRNTLCVRLCASEGLLHEHPQQNILLVCLLLSIWWLALFSIS